MILPLKYATRSLLSAMTPFLRSAAKDDILAAARPACHHRREPQPAGEGIAMPDVRMNTSSAAALAEAKERYAARQKQSARVYDDACKSLPGGNTRTVLFYDPFPLMFQRGAGCRLWDVDGHEYIDFLVEYTAGLYGHSHP